MLTSITNLHQPPKTIRRLVVILGDQLTLDNPALLDFDPMLDCVWMAEVAHESTKVWSHKARIVMFLSAMRHFKNTLETNGYPLIYRMLDNTGNSRTFVDELESLLKEFTVQELHLTQPGEWDVLEAIQAFCAEKRLPLVLYDDTHFLCSIKEFQGWAQKQSPLRMEFFYRKMRMKLNILMDGYEQPQSGTWNFDKDNRGAFGQLGPLGIEEAMSFTPDAITQAVINLVQNHFADHPGQLENFDFPVNQTEAELALDDFIEHRLPYFGQYQDAMWADTQNRTPYLSHSRLSAALNLKLLDPRLVVSKAVQAYAHQKASIQAVEGFIRQIIGWREYIRGVYWLKMPDFRDMNALNAQQPLPQFYWTANTEMHCLKTVIQQTLDYGYAHHIQRLMVTGLFALLLGVNPKAVHEWYLAVYVDAVEWVELPNTIGMSQFADGGFLGSKPYIASGKYIERMSNYCSQCEYNPNERTGEQACPFTTLYWDFLIRHEPLLQVNQRTRMQVRNLARISRAEQDNIQRLAGKIRDKLKTIS